MNTTTADLRLKLQYHSCTYDMKACESVFEWEGGVCVCVCVCVCVREWEWVYEVASERVSEPGLQFGGSFVLLGYNLSCPTVYHHNKTILHEMNESLSFIILKGLTLCQSKVNAGCRFYSVPVKGKCRMQFLSLCRSKVKGKCMMQVLTLCRSKVTIHQTQNLWCDSWYPLHSHVIFSLYIDLYLYMLSYLQLYYLCYQSDYYRNVTPTSCPLLMKGLWSWKHLLKSQTWVYNWQWTCDRVSYTGYKVSHLVNQSNAFLSLKSGVTIHILSFSTAVWSRCLLQCLLSISHVCSASGA